MYWHALNALAADVWMTSAQIVGQKWPHSTAVFIGVNGGNHAEHVRVRELAQHSVLRIQGAKREHVGKFWQALC